MIQSSNPTDALPEAKRSIVADMSPEAISLRLREFEDLHELWRSLQKCRIVGPIEESPIERKADK